MKNSFFYYYPIRKVNIVESFTNNLSDKSLEVLLDSYIEKPIDKEVLVEEVVNNQEEIDYNHYVSIVIIHNNTVYNNKDTFVPERIYIANFNIIVDRDGKLPTFKIPLEDENFKYKHFIREQIKAYFPIKERYIKTIKKINMDNQLENYHNYLVYIEAYDYGIQSISYKRAMCDNEYFLDNLTYLFSPETTKPSKEVSLKYIVDLLIKNNKFISKQFTDSISNSNTITDREILNTIDSAY
jgi:hypothetical protein